MELKLSLYWICAGLKSVSVIEVDLNLLKLLHILNCLIEG